MCKNYLAYKYVYVTGQLKLILDQYGSGSHQHLAPLELNMIRSIWEEAKNISEMSLPFVKQDDPEYSEKLKPLVDRPMNLAKDYRRIDLNLRWSHGLSKRTGKCLLGFLCGSKR